MHNDPVLALLGVPALGASQRNTCGCRARTVDQEADNKFTLERVSVALTGGWVDVLDGTAQRPKGSS